MIKIENIAEYGIEPAIRGMRNPMNSWAKSDTKYLFDENMKVVPILGKNDRDLMLRLAAAGPEHRKFMRMMTVTMDITAPLYWWKEMDTYKVGTVCDSCSTMHKIHAKPFSIDDFSTEHLTMPMLEAFAAFIPNLENCRQEYLKCEDKIWWWNMIQMLPSSYNQRRTMQFNYEVLRNIYWQRKNHKLTEWRTFCETILSELRYPELITAGKETDT